MKKQSDRELLKSFAKDGRLLLQKELGPYWISQPIDLKPTETNGWAADLGGIRGEKGAFLQLWLDDWTKASSRRFCFCLVAKSNHYVRMTAERVRTEFGQVKILDDESWEKDEKGIERLVKSLPRRLFDKPIAELYQNHQSWSFISFFHSAPPLERHRNRIARDGVRFLTRLAQALIGSRADKSSRDFPEEKNRKAVRSHFIRERSAALSRYVKERDSYVCQVCDLSFPTIYGDIGAGFAEAHHILPLAAAKLGAKTDPNDVKTVCANCHRMLHRMNGKRKDVDRLRQIVRKNKARLKDRSIGR